MAGAACKIILNGGIRALSESLEEVLTSPLVRDVMLPAKECDNLIQQLADVDLIAYRGNDGRDSTPSLQSILWQLYKAKVITDEVFELYTKGF